MKETYSHEGITLINADCMDVMKGMRDKEFDLAIVDPPYGIGADTHAGSANKGWTQWESTGWDKEKPNDELISAIVGAGRTAIVWGGNYFADIFPASQGLLVWFKMQKDFSLADGELAWTSFDKPMRIYKVHWCGSAPKWEDTKGKIHPTQKPVELYEWLIMKFSEQGQKILDIHCGSGSSRIACHKEKMIFVGCEIDKEYFDKAIERFKNYKSQLKLF